MRIVGTLALAALIAIPSGSAIAQAPADATNYPTRPIRIIVPFPAGGGTDILARLIGQRMSTDWTQPVVIDNRPGANTGIGAQAVARATPDGYTLLAAMDITMVMNPASGASMPYDPFKDFTPVTLLAKNGTLLLVRAEDGAKSVQELIAKGKANPGKLNYGGGVTIARLAGFMFAKTAGFDAVMIPYKGSSDAMQGLLSGSVDFLVDGVATSLPLIKSGKLRALAKLNNRALPALPDVPTLAAAMNLPFDEISAWTAIVAPTGTPPAIVAKVQQEVARIYADPVIAEKLDKLGITAISSTPAELGDFHRTEVARWTKVYRENNLNSDRRIAWSLPVDARDDIVALKDGPIAGTRTPDGIVRAFKGVPFAQPPVAELRWKPPEPVEPWTGVRRADSFGPRCVQVHRRRGSVGYFPPEPESEDCLYLNVWTAAREADAARPVMVWFHGGANFMGSGALPIFSGEGFARKGVVLVTVNYRLGRLGFLVHPELTRESGRNASGNYGLMDQIAALRWVKDNIAAFGGDPNRVTIFGQSAGSFSVSYYMASPLARGLFHRAIGQSGGGFGPVGQSSHLGEAMQTLDHAEASGAAFAAALGARSIADLRTRSPYEIQMARSTPDGKGFIVDRVNPPQGKGVFDTAYPIVDGYVLPESLRAIFGRGAQHDVPLMTGSTAHERATTSQPVATVPAYVDDAKLEFGAFAERYLALYPATTPTEVNEVGGYAIGDQNFTWQNWTWARLHARKAKSPVYYYRFSRVPPVSPEITFTDNPRKMPRAFHTAEIPYVFQTFSARDWPWRPTDHRLSEVMSSYWANFAANGDPNGAGLPAWPSFTAESEAMLHFDDETSVGPVPDRAKLDFWDAYYGYDAARARFAGD